MKIENINDEKIFLSMSFCVALFASCGGNANHDVVKTDKTVVSQAKSKQENKTRTIHVYFSVISLLI